MRCGRAVHALVSACFPSLRLMRFRISPAPLLARVPPHGCDPLCEKKSSRASAMNTDLQERTDASLGGPAGHAQPFEVRVRTTVARLIEVDMQRQSFDAELKLEASWTEKNADLDMYVKLAKGINGNEGRDSYRMLADWVKLPVSAKKLQFHVPEEIMNEHVDDDDTDVRQCRLHDRATTRRRQRLRAL